MMAKVYRMKLLDHTRGHAGKSGHVGELSLRKVIVYALIAGISVTNLYFAQPIVTIIAHSLGIGKKSLGMPLSATQMSYAAGILFIVPLGDYIDRKKLVPGMLVLSGIALLCYALAANITFLTISSILLGCTAVSGQLLIPMIGDLAPVDKRGKYVGIVASGLVIGVLSARILSGFFTSLWGWRSIFFFGAVVSFLCAVIMLRIIPSFRDNSLRGQSYPQTIFSVFRFIRQSRTLYSTMVLGAINFGSFIMFWTGLGLFLAGPIYNFSAWKIGLCGLVGLVSAMAVQGVGRLYDKGYANYAVSIFGLIMLLGWLLSYLRGAHMMSLILGIIAIDIGSQSQNILHQTRLLALAGHARSRVNTAYVVGNFLGAALGSIITMKLWLSGGWTGICLAGIIAAVLGIVFFWLALRMKALELPISY